MPCFVNTISNGESPEKRKGVYVHNWHSLSLHVFQRAIMLITRWVPKTKWTLYMASQMVRCFLVPTVQYGRPATSYTHKKRATSEFWIIWFSHGWLYTHVKRGGGKKRTYTHTDVRMLYWKWKSRFQIMTLKRYFAIYLFIFGLLQHSTKWM